MKEPVVFFTIADDKNLPFAQMLEKSFKHFHKDIPFKIITGEELDAYRKDDPNFFYRATPIVGENLIKDYELVVKIDADSIVTGDLSYIWNTKDYDVGCVLNYNRVDAMKYGFVQGWGILPIEYVNCGLVAMRNAKFVHEWKVWCFSNQFDRTQYKEQDGLNIKVYHGNWNVRIFDHGDGPAKMAAWWGLIAKSDWSRVFKKDGVLVVPKHTDGTIPPMDMELKIIHFAGGSDAQKMNYKTLFSEEVSKYIDTLVV